MKKLLPVVAVLLIATILLWKNLSHKGSANVEGEAATKSAQSPVALSEVILERVKKAARSQVPAIGLDGRESLSFAELDGGIDELDVMQVLLAVETEFGTDIPEKTLWSLVGEENRRDYLHHLTLRKLAQAMEEILRGPSQSS